NDLLATLKSLPALSIVLLLPCCHNPSGAVLTSDQWDAVFEILKDRLFSHFRVIDYIVFGDCMVEDSDGISAISISGLTSLVMYS
ncbi:aminotransferase class I/II-fold pyridoxal phosphate-dependent enzyme, partial [Escherichia coli]